MNKFYLSLLVVSLMLCFFSQLNAIRYSAFIPELTYTPYVSSVADNYTQPEPRYLPECEDSIWWEIPIRNWDTFKRFGYSLFSNYKDENAIFRYHYKNQGLDFFNRSNYLMGYDGTFFPGSQFNFFYVGFNQQAWLNDKWSFHSQFTYSSLRGDSLRASQSPILNSHWKYYGHHFEFGDCTAGINYEDNIIKASIGRGRLNMGNSITGSILLNDRVNDYAFMTAEFQIGTFVISLMNAQLMADSTLAIYHNHILNNHNYPNKYFVAHQFTWQPAHQVNIYAGETLIYGNTAFNFNYLLPQGYHRVIADSDHDRDNATMYAGFDWHLHDRWLFYFTFMMDEFRPEKLLHDWWGNKYAGQGGVSYLWPYQLAENKRIRTTFEATAVRPWTYTHNLMYDKYTQDNHCLGFPFGANLIHFAGRLDVPLPWDCSYTSYASFMRQGVSTIPGEDNVGYSYLTNYGTYFDTFNELYDSTAQWLQGKIVNTYRIENSFRIGILKHHHLFLSQAAEKTSHSHWNNQIVFGWQLAY
ncbi:MAG: hypothetical protein ACE14O_07290 [Candidatus Cloacimonadaceae bacterium]